MIGQLYYMVPKGSTGEVNAIIATLTGPVEQGKADHCFTLAMWLTAIDLHVFVSVKWRDV